MTAACPCNGDTPYRDCCAPLHRRQKNATTAEQLMRSRYSAYALGLTDYIRATTLPAQQNLLDSAAITECSRKNWQKLEISDYRPHSSPQHAHITFTAYWQENNTQFGHHERSAFVCTDGLWYFIDPTVPLPATQSDCLCGSGKKFKHCCKKQLNDSILL